MKRIILAAIAVLAISVVAADRAEAQYPVNGYYAPVPVRAYYPPTVVYRPAHVAPPVTAYYRAPRPVAVTSYYAPAPVAYAPTVMYRPVVGFYSPYGGPEIRVPGQPVRNTLRAIVP